jgi:capsular exopolysaccharide synthesis family protein
MSSIRDALKRAERERQSRQVTEDHPRVKPSSSSAEEGPARRHLPEPEPAPRLEVVQPDTIPTLEVPIDFTEELALFRHGVEAAVPKPRRALIVTSATSGEGVTTLTTYVSVSLAVRDGKKTCLIDTNFKSPRTSRIFGLLGRPGLSDYCTGRAELAEVLCKTDSPDLFIMGLGTEVYNPSLVLSHERARALPMELTQRFDYVLFDAGSVLGHAETSMLAPSVDGVVLIVRANRTKREVLAKAEKLVRFSGGKVIGTVLNRRRFPIPESIYKRL